MGLIVSVFRDSTLCDCTNGGISATAKGLTLVNVSGPFEPSEKYPAAMLVKGNLAGIAKIVPAEEVSEGVYEPVKGWVMMGGNYAATSDSRFSEAVERITGSRFSGAIPIHDRIEG